ncbi:unnamed protein product, partial [Allacma fusca]
TLKG